MISLNTKTWISTCTLWLWWNTTKTYSEIKVSQCLSQEKSKFNGSTLSVGYEQLDANAALIDGAAMVQMNAPNLAKINGENSKTEIGDVVYARRCPTSWHNLWCLSKRVITDTLIYLSKNQQNILVIMRARDCIV